MPTTRTYKKLRSFVLDCNGSGSADAVAFLPSLRRRQSFDEGSGRGSDSVPEISRKVLLTVGLRSFAKKILGGIGLSLNAH